MRQLFTTTFISVDGVMEAPGGEPGYAHSGWVGPHFTDELGTYKGEEQEAAEVMLLGRRTYEGFYGAWPDREGPMAEKINTMRKVVASTTLGSSDWHDTTVVADLLPAVRDLKAEEGGPIIVPGSRSVVQALLAAGLVDEIHLQVFPIVLGSGMRLWAEAPDTLALSLVSSVALDSGVQLQTWRPAAARTVDT